MSRDSVGKSLSQKYLNYNSKQSQNYSYENNFLVRGHHTMRNSVLKGRSIRKVQVILTSEYFYKASGLREMYTAWIFHIVCIFVVWAHGLLFFGD